MLDKSFSSFALSRKFSLHHNMSASTSALSETLQSITVTKIRELEKQKESYNAKKVKAVDAVRTSEDVRKRLANIWRVLRDNKELVDYHSDSELFNIKFWMKQAIHDPSVTEAKLLECEQELISRLEQNSRKLDLAHLYSRLLTDWIKSSPTAESDLVDLDQSDSEESFEVVQDTQKARLEQLRDKFARVVFEPLETDETEIDNYLSSLFEGDDGQSALKDLRRDVKGHGKLMLSDYFRMDARSLQWCIKALLKNQLLNDEKKASLNDFLKDEAVLSEIRDVLNMRIRDLKDWEWNLGDDGMPVVPRQSLNGKWRVMMDEDVLQALLTHWTGTRWAVFMKGELNRMRWKKGLWKQGSSIPDDDRAKYKYFFDEYTWSSMNDGNNVAQERQKVYDDDFFMAPLPSKEFEEAGGYDEDDEVTGDDDKKSPKDIKQLLLRTLATEVIMRRSLDGEVAVVQSDFQWFATGIAHSTVFAVMRFMGFQEEWITFFRKVMEPPLNMLDGGPVRIRKRGLPMAHVFEKLFGELVLFFMDLAVAQNGGMNLYRFHDDLWLAGSPKACASAWKTMEDFATVMGLEFNKHKTGSVYLTDGKHSKSVDIMKALPDGPVAMNFLILDPESGKWIINTAHVQEHITQLQKQLNSSKSVLAWIKTWNSCIGRFFSYTFGEPAHCFGKDHVDAILKAHRDMQHHLFDDTETGKTVAEHIKHNISTSFSIPVEEIPDSFIFMPEDLGGLGLKNPFISLLLIRDETCKDIEKRMADFHTREREDYDNFKKAFDLLSEKQRRKKYKDAFQRDEDEGSTPPITWQQAQEFLSFEEFTKHREQTSTLLLNEYKVLLRRPDSIGVQGTKRVKNGLKSLSYTPEGLDYHGGACDDELFWLVHYFEKELFEKFGGLEVVDKSLLPLGVLKALKARRVTWQMVL